MKPTCLKCTRVKDVPKCLDQLVIGTISQTNTNVHVYFQTSTEILTRFTAQSDGAGLVVLDTTNFEPNQVLLYNLWVTLENSGVYNNESLTIEGSIDPVECVAFNFNTIYNGNGSVISFASQTLELCD